ncbi:MAG: T9SS type A sorting domain-containing protein [candidate division WOR-3 bacterium]
MSLCSGGTAVIDGYGDTVRKFLPSGTVAWNPRTNHVYGATSDTIFVLDGTTDSIIARIPGNYAGTSGVVLNPTNDILYLTKASDSRIVAVDVSDDSVGYEPLALGVDPDSGYVFAACANSAVYVIRDQVPGGATEVPGMRPVRTTTLEVRPNPALRGIEVLVQVPVRTHIALSVLDTAGRVVASLYKDELGPGQVIVPWDGTAGEQRLPAGAYFVRLEAGGEKLTRKLILPR